uniref:HTH_Tnp_Tc3_1 domain-containing protein n=1 Tax=Caenorhabditis japonica TaxID=281687 RepID=A0A8R1EPX8_CAEJA
MPANHSFDPFLTPAEQAKVDVMHQLGLKLHEMSRQLGRSRNAIRRYATDPINYGKKQKLPQTTQHPHLPTGKRRKSHQQLYKGLVSFETSGQLVAQISINRESLWYSCPSRLSSRKTVEHHPGPEGCTKY